jgi:hypothetical protein
MTKEKIRALFIQECKRQHIPIQLDINGVLFGLFLAEQVLALFAVGIDLGAEEHALHQEFS